MAPEQLEGKEADARTDIFAFGSVLYEMVTSKRAFEGKSQASLIAAILERDPPPITSLQPMTPPALDRVVKTCLAKDPDERWQTAHDLMGELKWIAEGGSQAGVAAPVIAPRKSRDRLGWMVAAMAILALLASLPFTIAHLRQAPADTHVMKFSIPPPEKASLGPVAVSPDGRWLAFTATTGGKDQLWVRPLDGLTLQALPGTEGAGYPFWSPDNRFIGFFAGGKLKKIEVSGGPPQTLCEAADGRGGTWNRNGTIVFSPSPTGVLYSVPAMGGVASPATVKATSATAEIHRFPHFLPDGRHFLFLVTRAAGGNNGTYLASLDSNQPRRLLSEASNAEYVRPSP